jgi:hypothetical protein
MDPRAPQLLHAPHVVSMMMETDRNHLQQQLLLNPPLPYHVMMICWIIVSIVDRSLHHHHYPYPQQQQRQYDNFY